MDLLDSVARLVAGSYLGASFARHEILVVHLLLAKICSGMVTKSAGQKNTAAQMCRMMNMV